MLNYIRIRFFSAALFPNVELGRTPIPISGEQSVNPSSPAATESKDALPEPTGNNSQDTLRGKSKNSVCVSATFYEIKRENRNLCLLLKSKLTQRCSKSSGLGIRDRRPPAASLGSLAAKGGWRPPSSGVPGGGRALLQDHVQPPTVCGVTESTAPLGHLPGGLILGLREMAAEDRRQLVGAVCFRSNSGKCVGEMIAI